MPLLCSWKEILMAPNVRAQLTLQPVNEAGWRSGLANLWRRESQHWWQTWFWQVVIWVFLLDGFTAIAGAASRTPLPAGSPPSPSMIVLVLLFFTVFPAFGTLVMAHGKLFDEQQSGTAAWILSKPVTRTAFVLSKFACLPGMLLTMTLIPGALAYPLIWFFQGKMPSLLTFGLMLSLNASFITFFFCLMLLLGVLLKKRAAILGLGIFTCFVMLQALFQNNAIARVLIDQWPLLLLVTLAVLAGALICFLLTLSCFARVEF